MHLEHLFQWLYETGVLSEIGNYHHIFLYLESSMPTIQKKLITLITWVSKANLTLKLNMYVIHLTQWPAHGNTLWTLTLCPWLSCYLAPLQWQQYGLQGHPLTPTLSSQTRSIEGPSSECSSLYDSPPKTGDYSLLNSTYSLLPLPSPLQAVDA